jgi:hypothetical protein
MENCDDDDDDNDGTSSHQAHTRARMHANDHEMSN